MQFRIPLVFCLVAAITASVCGSVHATLPPTLRITMHVANDEDRALLARVFATRVSTILPWTVQFGIPLISAPCASNGPRAELQIDLNASNGGVREAEIALLDCAAWPVAAWSFSVPAGTFGLRSLVGQTIFALREWQHHEPSRFAALFDTGDAATHDGACNPELRLVKTSDGQMRAIVRAGGTAYISGIRTSDIVMRIDGRFWWEYGTYQAQQLADNGESHVYTLSDSGKEYRVACARASTNQSLPRRLLEGLQPYVSHTLIAPIVNFRIGASDFDRYRLYLCELANWSLNADRKRSIV